MITQRFRLDMVPDGSRIHEVRVSQHDSPVHLEIGLYAHKGDFAIPAAAKATMEGTTASGVKVTCACAISGDTVRLDLPDAVTAEMGRHAMQIVLTDGGRELRSSRFVVGIEGDPVLLT